MQARPDATLLNETGAPSHRGVDCRNWYVLFTLAGTEMKIKNEINDLLSQPFDLYIPRRELFHRFQGNDRKVVKPLFPGYIFIYKKIETFMIAIGRTHLNGRLRPVMYDRRYAMVEEHEMALLMKISDPTGLVPYSCAIWDRGSALVVKSGPLKELTGKLLYINKRKRKARIQISLLQRTVEVTLGLEILEPV